LNNPQLLLEAGAKWEHVLLEEVLPFKNLRNTSHFVTLFLAHGDVVVGFAIFHIVYSKNKKIKNKKRHSSMVCECWWAPDGIG
jgi:hypothetical protein